MVDLIWSMWFKAGVIFPLALHGMGTSRTHGVETQPEEMREGAMDIVTELSSVTEEHSAALKDLEKGFIPGKRAQLES
jgi:hypothetical protein